MTQPSETNWPFEEPHGGFFDTFDTRQNPIERGMEPLKIKTTFCRYVPEPQYLAMKAVCEAAIMLNEIPDTQSLIEARRYATRTFDDAVSALLKLAKGATDGNV